MDSPSGVRRARSGGTVLMSVGTVISLSRVVSQGLGVVLPAVAVFGTSRTRTPFENAIRPLILRARNDGCG